MFGRKPTRDRLGSCQLMAFVATVDAARAKTFYRDVLGLRLISEDGSALVFDANGTKLRVSIVPALHPAGYTVLGWIVPDVSKVAHELGEHAVTFERFPGLEQDALGIWCSPGGAKVAWFRDPDGNMLSITQITFSKPGQ